MRCFRLGASMLALAGLLLGMAAVGCGGAKEEEGDDDGSVTRKAPRQAKREAIPPGTATVKGKVTFAGSNVTFPTLDAEVTQQMKASASTTEHCLTNAPEDQRGQQTWRVNPENKGVADVVVFLTPADRRQTFFSVSADHPGVKAAQENPAVLDQPHCAFLPRVLVHFPEYSDAKGKTQETGQKLLVKNSAAITHNTKIEGGNKNPGVNETIESGGELVINSLKADIVPVGVSCTIHGWMRANVWVLDHPYFAVTDENGEFEIKNAPEGEVHIAAWHAGQVGNFLVKGGYGGVPITLKAGGVTEKNFEARAE